MTNEERRMSQRTTMDIVVRFSEDSGEITHRTYQEGIIENYSAGGMYITTDAPLARGKVALLTFRLKSQQNAPLPIQVRVTVRWVRQVSNPRGMGVEFLDFEGIDESDFKTWITNLLGL